MPPRKDTAGSPPQESFFRRLVAKAVEAATAHLAVATVTALLSVVGAAVGSAALVFRAAETAKPGSASTQARGRLVPGVSVAYEGLTVKVVDQPSCATLPSDMTKASCEIPVALINETSEPQLFRPFSETYLYIGLLRFPVVYDVFWPDVFPGRSANATLRFIVPVGSSPTKLELGGGDRTFYFT